MSALESEGSQGDPGNNGASQLDQPAGESFYLPFSQELSVDEDLNFTKKEFKQAIYDFYKGKDLPPLSQLRAPFPTPHVLAQFASKAYTDYEKRETDDQYETRLGLPGGWKLLTTASNSSYTDGYFGAAYWHPEHQQVVIAHRGTVWTNLGALWTDVVGVIFKYHAPQMSSASTFAHTVVEVLREVNGASFHLFFTGHSLGGWLAQVTTFTTEYLKREGNYFQRNNNDQNCCHAHTVVFESPGCKDILSKMTDAFDVRQDGCSIDIEHLDITSYLSAPNCINTCNSHLGTVYRIFPDLSDMRCWHKNTPLYNIATHSMQKILDVFDPETGHVCKDELRRLKVQVVVDWPISAGLSGKKEYSNFFRHAEHLNNYHPDIKDIKDEIRCLKGYHPLRYQTKTYDERVSSLRVFCQQEQQFLESYRWLHQLPEFFNLEELFSVMGNNQDQEQAKEMLQGFEIENDKIHCTNASTLQVLIPYVKRLLQLFPQIKENTNHALSSDGVRNRVYQIETKRYVGRISQSPIHFKTDDLSLRDFVNSDHEKVLQLSMVDGDEWTGLIKIYRSLQNTGCLNEGQYTVLKLKRLLSVNHLMDFSTLMQSIEAPHRLLVACDTNQPLDDEAQHIIKTIFNNIKQKPNIKIFLTTRSDSTTPPPLQQIGKRIFGKGFVTRPVQLTWSDITTETQEKILTETVSFQDTDIALNELMSADSPVANLLPLGTLLEGKHLQIGKPVPISNAYNKGYYIGRKLRRYIDTDSSHTCTTDDLDKLLEQTQDQRVMLISDTAGMGKSTILTHLSKEIKQKFPAKWMVRIDLNDHTDALNELKQIQIDKQKAIEFVSERVLKLEPDFELKLFKQCCKEKQKVKIVIMLDGFDEISPSYKDTVIDLLQALRQTAVEQLWVTTRPHLRKELEDKLQQPSYTLEPFSVQNQVEFLTKFWSLKDWFTVTEGKEEIGKDKLQTYAKYLIEELAKSISDKDREFTGIPLQTRLLAEAFDKEVRTFYGSAESMPVISFKLDLVGLYVRFIERKYDIYQEEKFKVQQTNEIAIEQREHDLKCMREDYQLLALKVLFSGEERALFQSNRECTFSAGKLSRIGIVQVSDDGKLHFIHRTFAEYYVADCLVNSLTKGNKTSEKLQTFILQDIFIKGYYQVTRVFIDGLLSRSIPSDEALKQCGNGVHDLGHDCLLTVYRALFENNFNIAEMLLDSLQAAEHRESLVQLLLLEDYEGKTVTLMPTAKGKSRMLEKIWKWANEKLKTEEINNELLLSTGCMRKNIFHMAAEWGNLEVLQKVWECANKKLTPEEIKNNLLLATYQWGRTVFDMAAEKGRLEILDKLREWANEKLTPEEIKKVCH